MKKITSLLVVLIILMMAIVYAESGDDRYNEGYNEGYRNGYDDGSSEVYIPRVPKLIITNKDIILAKAGEYVDITIDFKNDSEYTAHDIKISPVFDGSIFEYEMPAKYESESYLRKGKEGVATFSLKVKPVTKLGVYELKFNMEYTNSSKENYSSTGSVFVRVVEEKVKSLITIDNVRTNPERVTAGNTFELSFDAHNIGDLEAKEVYLMLNGLSGTTFMPLNSKDVLYVGSISGNTTYTAKFDMVASKDINKGGNTLGVTATYLNSDGQNESIEKTFYILDVVNDSKNSEDNGDTNTSKPKIIIESYSVNTDSIVAGDTINFTFSFRNTNNYKSMSNMKITVSSQGAFMIAHGSNTFFVEKLAPKALVSKSIVLNVKQDLTSSSYPVNISFDYEDQDGVSYVANEVINLPVTEYSKLVINSASVYSCIIGEPTSLSFDYINMGKAKVSNLTASVEGDFESVQTINYIGNLEAGNSDYYDIQVIPTKEGDLNGTLVLTFEDSSGKKIEEKKAFSSFAMPAYNPGIEDDPSFYDDPSINEETSGKVFKWWEFLLYGLLGFAVSFFVTKLITAKIIKKKLDDEI